MGIHRRGEVWWIRFSAPDGERVRKSSGTQDKRSAQELHDRLKAETWRKGALAEKPKYTWEDAVVQWLKEKSHKASLKKDKEIFVGWIGTWAGDGWSISTGRCFRILEGKAAAANQATANRYMALVRAGRVAASL